MRYPDGQFARGARRALVAALLVCGAGAALAAGQWHTVQAPHYEVSTDVSRAFTKLVAQHMEAIHGEYERRFRSYEVRNHERFQVKVFARQEDYKAAVPPSVRASTGAFVSRDRFLGAFKEGHTEEVVFRTLYHEGFHQFLYSCVAKDVPLWFNEGFAEYFAEATWNGSSFTTGQVPWTRLHVLREAFRDGTDIPLKQLFKMRSEEWLARVRTDEPQASVQYCEAWSVIHFLLHAQGGRYRKKALEYLKLVSKGADHDEAFAESFGSDVRGFERAWRAYVMKLKPGPDAVCRKNLEIIAFLALSFYGELGRFKSLEGLRGDLLRSRRVRWEVTTGDGEKITSRDKRRIESLFRCPRDRGGGRVSYTLLRDPRSGRPEIYCTHHPGIVMKAYDVPDAAGETKVQVERIVWATLPGNVVRKLHARGR